MVHVAMFMVFKMFQGFFPKVINVLLTNFHKCQL